jgi:hypothetical protein
MPSSGGMSCYFKPTQRRWYTRLRGTCAPVVRLSFMSRTGAACDRFRPRRTTIGAASGSSRRSVGPVPIPMRRVTCTRRSLVRACRRHRCECSFIGGGAGCTDWLQAVADLAGILLPRMEQLGVATATEVEVATLAQRLRREVTAGKHMIIGRSEIGVWSQLQPGSKSAPRQSGVGRT